MARAWLVKYVAMFSQELGHIRYLNWGAATDGTVHMAGTLDSTVGLLHFEDM